MAVAARVLFVFAAVFSLAGVALGAGEPVDSSNVDATVLASDDAWIVEFQSPRCGSCQEMAPVWGQFVERNKRHVRFGQVNIDTDEGMELARSSGVIEHGIPSIWAWDVRGSAEPTKIWADFETPTVQHLESLVWSKYAKREEGLPLAKLDSGVVA